MSRFLTKKEIIEIHKFLIEEFGGSHGVRDDRSLEAAIMRPQSGYYKTIFHEAAALFESLTNNHPFIDGNKRIGFFAMDTFLRLNGFYINCNNEEAYQFFMGLFNTNKFNFDNLYNWIKNNSIKLKATNQIL